MNKAVDLALRVFGGATAILCAFLGGAYIVVFFFIGQAAGFTDRHYTLTFTLMLLYSIGVFGLATWLAFRPSILRGVSLLGMVVPYLAWSYFGLTGQ